MKVRGHGIKAVESQRGKGVAEREFGGKEGQGGGGEARKSVLVESLIGKEEKKTDKRGSEGKIVGS